MHLIYNRLQPLIPDSRVIPSPPLLHLGQLRAVLCVCESEETMLLPLQVAGLSVLRLQTPPPPPCSLLCPRRPLVLPFKLPQHAPPCCEDPLGISEMYTWEESGNQPPAPHSGWVHPAPWQGLPRPPLSFSSRALPASPLPCSCSKEEDRVLPLDLLSFSASSPPGPCPPPLSPAATPRRRTESFPWTCSAFLPLLLQVCLYPSTGCKS